MRLIYFHPTGQPRDTLYLIDGKKREGIVRKYDRTGGLTEEATIRKGSAQGPFRQWHPYTHTLSAEGTVVDGELDGLYTTYATDGHKVSQAMYKKGKQHGWMEEWDERGILTERNFYKESDLRETEYLNNSGQVYERIVYDDVKPRLVEQRDASGKMRTVTTITGKGIEKMELHYPNGNLQSEKTYVDGKLDGTLRAYSVNGALMREISFREGSKEGWEKTYYPSGRVKTEWYYHPEQAGHFRRYRESGKILIMGYQFPDGTAHGPSIEYSTLGKPLYETNYSMGALNGAYAEYDPKGNCLRCDSFSKGLLLQRKLFDTAGRIWHQTLFPKGDGILLASGTPNIVIARDTLKGGRLEGIAASYYAPGIPLRKALFRSGDLEGEMTLWHPNGVMAMHDTERISNTEGIHRGWDEVGNLLYESRYTNNEEDGPEYRYHAGVLRSIRTYRSGIYHGPYFLMYGTADTLGRLDFVEGHLLQTQVRDSMGRWQEPRLAPKGDADVRTYYPKGGLAADYHYRHNVMDGIQTSWHPNGKKADELHYSAGKLEGLYERWYPDGTPYFRVPYVENEPEGEE